LKNARALHLWCNFHHKNIMRLTSFKRNCHFCFFSNGFIVNIGKEIFCYFYTSIKNYYFVHIGSSQVRTIKTTFILNFFANVRLHHNISTKGKFNWLTEQHTFAIMNYKLTLRRQGAVNIETAITIEPYFVANIETWRTKHKKNA